MRLKGIKFLYLRLVVRSGWIEIVDDIAEIALHLAALAVSLRICDGGIRIINDDGILIEAIIPKERAVLFPVVQDIPEAVLEPLHNQVRSVKPIANYHLVQLLPLQVVLQQHLILLLQLPASPQILPLQIHPYSLK